MKRVAIVVGVVVLALAIAWWLRGDDDKATSTTATAAKPTTATKRSATEAQPRVDPATLVRASIAGTVTDEAKAPVPSARVCAGGSSHELDPNVLRDPICVAADAQGRYALPNLLPAKYTVSASAKPFRPGVHYVNGDRKKTSIRLAAGQQLAGADIVLRPGGVELTGVVADITGGPIDKARVVIGGGRWSDSASVVTETAADGTFSAWVAPGSTSVNASAEGYADEWEWSRAPGKIEILLTPESSLSGIVVDAASGEPIEGARVSAGGDQWGEEGAFTDAKGTFRITRLTPGRYIAIAKTDRGYGRTEGSTLVGLGQSVEGVVVKLHPAVRIEGKVIISSTKQGCEEPRVSIADGPKGRWTGVRSEPDGRVWAEGVLPGKYSVDVSCEGFQSKEKYEPIVVADKDITGLVWEVEPGAKIEGRVLGKNGAPVENADVSASTIGGEARKKGAWGSDKTIASGAFTLDGLKAGTYKLSVSSERGIAPKDGFKVDVPAGATVQKDLVLEEAGTIKGTVVDGDGKPVANISAHARLLDGGQFWSGDDNKTDEAGTFTIENVRPGNYRVMAQRTWNDALKKPGTTDDAEQGERITVRANQTATVRIVVEALTGTIKGTVTDASGAAVADAFISAARESEAAGAQKASTLSETRWSWDNKPVLTNTDGTFTLTKLSPGKYTVRAFRKGGGEAIAQHVAVGGTATLQIKPTGLISGTVRNANGAPEEISLTIRDLVTGYWRREQFFRTDGRFSVPDLPKGKFQVSASAEGGQAQLDIELAEGEQKTNVAIELGALVTLTGRVIEHGTNKPVAAIRMSARPAMGGGGFSFSTSGDERDHITDEQGRFTIKNAPRGKVMLRGMPRDWGESDYGFMSFVKQVDGTGTVELGDLTIFKNRVKQNEPAGKLGINFVQSAPDAPPDTRKLEVAYIDPAGPAAKTEIKVGDVIVSIDGIDITGANVMNAGVLMRAPPGTKLALGLARKTTVTVVLAPP